MRFLCGIPLRQLLQPDRSLTHIVIRYNSQEAQPGGCTTVGKTQRRLRALASLHACFCSVSLTLLPLFECKSVSKLSIHHQDPASAMTTSSGYAASDIEYVRLSRFQSDTATLQAASQILQVAHFPIVSKLWEKGEAVYIAKIGSVVVGVFSIGSDGVSPALTNIATRHDLVRKNIGRHMLARAKAMYPQNLRACVMDENRDFYHHAGFETDSEDNRSGSMMRPKRSNCRG